MTDTVMDREKYKQGMSGKGKIVIQFFITERGKQVFLRKTLEVRLSDRGGIGEGERGRESEGLRYNVKIPQCCRKFVCTWKCTMQNTDHTD